MVTTVKDKNGNDIWVGSLVAVSPNSGWYGKWRVAIVEEIGPVNRWGSATCKFRYKEPVLKNEGYVGEKIVLSKSISRSSKDSRDLVVLDPSFIEE